MMDRVATGDLRLGHIMEAAGLPLEETLVFRHTFTDDLSLDPQHISTEQVRLYTRDQNVGNKTGVNPPRIWACFVAERGLRCRLAAVFENRGQVESPSATLRRFDLVDSPYLAAMTGRLLIEWSRDTINWVKRGDAAARLKVISISDQQREIFPGFAGLDITHAHLEAISSNQEYADWASALRSMKGIYLITDPVGKQLYVGKADGQDGLLGRWMTYARTKHGDNVALVELLRTHPERLDRLRYSVLRVFDMGASSAEIDGAESHFKKILLTREIGLNRN